MKSLHECYLGWTDENMLNVVTHIDFFSLHSYNIENNIFQLQGQSE